MHALAVSLCLSLSYKMMESHISGATADISQASPHLGTLRVSDIVWEVIKGCSLTSKDISYRISFPRTWILLLIVSYFGFRRILAFGF